jgi:hypothetical protein
VALTVDQTTDIWCDGEDMRPEQPEVSGALCVAQRLMRRWTTPKGLFKFWPNEGHDARQYLLSKEPPWRIKSALEAEALRDEQVEICQVTPTLLDNGATLNLDGFFTTKLGVFKFSMNVTDAAATLIALEAASG